MAERAIAATRELVGYIEGSGDLHIGLVGDHFFDVELPYVERAYIDVTIYGEWYVGGEESGAALFECLGVYIDDEPESVVKAIRDHFFMGEDDNCELDTDDNG